MSKESNVSLEICQWISTTLHTDLADVEAKANSPIREIIDSMTMINLLFHIEETFSISIEDDEITPESFDTIASIVGFVEAKIRA